MAPSFLPHYGILTAILCTFILPKTKELHRIVPLNLLGMAGEIGLDVGKSSPADSALFPGGGVKYKG